MTDANRRRSGFLVSDGGVVRTARRAARVLAAIGLSLVFARPLSPAVPPADTLGAPFIRNYSIDEYGAHAQNWAAVQDKRGIMYFGNGNGALEYDGWNWTLIPTPNNSLVRSLDIDRQGTVFYGSQGDFGYLGADTQGKLQAVSLVGKLKTEDRAFNDVWNTLATSRGIYFLTTDKIFRFHDDLLDVIPVSLDPGYGFRVDDTIVLILKNKGLAAVSENEVIPLPGSKDLTISQVGWICGTPFGDRKALFATRSGSLFVYDLGFFHDPESGRFDFSRPVSSASLLTPFACQASGYISERNNSIYKATRIDDDSYALTTMKGGVVIIDRGGRIVRVIDQNRGLQGNAVRDAFLDRNDNLWLPLNNGISCVDYRSPVSRLGTQNGLPDYLVAVSRYEVALYVGSFSGVFVLSPEGFEGPSRPPSFAPVRNCISETFAFLTYKGLLLAGTNTGVFRIQGRSGVRVCDQPGIYTLGTTSKYPDHVWIGGREGLALLEVRTTAGRNPSAPPQFISRGRVPGIPDTIRKIVEDGDGDLWLTTDIGGLIHLMFTDSDPFRFEIQRLGMAQGLPRLDFPFVHYLRKRLLLGTPEGIFEILGTSGGKREDNAFRIVPERTFGLPFLSPPAEITNIMLDGEGNLVVNSSRGIFLIHGSGDGSYRWERNPFLKIPVNDVDDLIEEDGILWAPTTKGLFRYDPSIRKDYAAPFNALVRKVTAGEGEKRVIFNGAVYAPEMYAGGRPATSTLVQPSAFVPRLLYRENSIAFEVSAAFYEPLTEVRFKHILEPFNRDWTDWTGERRSEYTNLPPGRYTFRVKARNSYDLESGEAVFRFSIKPPWYRTIPAYGLFLILAGAGLIGFLKLNTLTLRKEKSQLEKIVALRTQELKEASLTDPLTGLRNRRFLYEILAAETSAFLKFKNFTLIDKSRRVSAENKRTVFGLFLFDLDFFKSVNDTYGHEAGDRVLQQFAAILRGSVREDDAVLRYGGEEFLLILKKTLPEYLDEYAVKIFGRIRGADFELKPGTIIKITASFGYAAFPFYDGAPDFFSLDQSIQIADQGLYYAKAHGRNMGIRIIPSEETPRRGEDANQILTSLESALEEKRIAIRATK